jgi:hypothetical protein
MPSTLDNVLNWLIPVLIILIFVAVLYAKFRTPINQVGRWIKNLFGYGAETLGSVGEKTQKIGYE